MDKLQTTFARCQNGQILQVKVAILVKDFCRGNSSFSQSILNARRNLSKKENKVRPSNNLKRKKLPDSDQTASKKVKELEVFSLDNRTHQ